MQIIQRLTDQQAWNKLQTYAREMYDGNAALYSGDHNALKTTADAKTFWRRSGKCKIHVPIAADICNMSASLLFSSEPKFTVYHDGTEQNEGKQQDRLEKVITANKLPSKLTEAGETASALGDVYLKARWHKDIDYPMIDVVQGDQAWPEYYMGDLHFVHFFTEVTRDFETGEVIRMAECYGKGTITMALYKGTESELGSKLEDSSLASLGYEPEIKTPVDDILAVHVANIRPNRKYRSIMLGRSDLDQLRDLCDALDEAYSSWIRDVRLAKAKLIVPVQYLRRKPDEMLNGVASSGSWEFDEDVETYVAMDIDTERYGGITPSQFAIRSAEHAQTCSQLIETILQFSGYSPQTFGIDVAGTAASGTSLTIRERKSTTTRNKKQTYWEVALERFMTTVMKLDYALFPNEGSDGNDIVRMKFFDGIGQDDYTLAQTVNLLNQAQSASKLIRVRMLHPDWSEQSISDELERLETEYTENTEPEKQDVQ